ncbi:DNA repair protein RadC [candidate division WOR-3 bacterium]|nr:DNA repair protein RadC [candidate division WOR-3 bacterium]
MPLIAMKIKYWPENERPRERAKNYGIESLSNAELLAIIIGKGARDLSAVDLGRELLRRFKNLKGLGNAHIEDLKKIKGIKDAKALAISAVFELARRYQSSREERKWVLGSPEEVYDYYSPKLSHLSHEEFHVAILDTRNTLIKDHLVSKGILDATVVHPREIFMEVLRYPCAGIILVHNHPGGNPEPSDEDIGLTRRIVEAGRIFGIDVLDHVIVCKGKYVSFRARSII